MKDHYNKGIVEKLLWKNPAGGLSIINVPTRIVTVIGVNWNVYKNLL